MQGDVVIHETLKYIVVYHRPVGAPFMIEQSVAFCPSCGERTPHHVHKTDLRGIIDWVQCLRCGIRHAPVMVM
ncbi:MAG TPA: hypothetical protein EYP43_02130 [Thermoplasmata archaeon]|nr:hypothetical protein [Thermoplasmata archaeon]